MVLCVVCCSFFVACGRELVAFVVRCLLLVVCCVLLANVNCRFMVFDVALFAVRRLLSLFEVCCLLFECVGKRLLLWLFVVCCCLLFAGCCLVLFTVCCFLFVVCCLLSVVCSVLLMMCGGC